LSNPRGSFKRFVGAMLSREDGRILCQKRDRHKKILYPGYWTCTPGGHVESGEELRQAIRREIFEEFELKISGLRFCATFIETKEPARGIYYFFKGRVYALKNGFECHEGEKAEFFDKKSLNRLRLHPISRKFLDYSSGKTP